MRAAEEIQQACVHNENKKRLKISPVRLKILPARSCSHAPDTIGLQNNIGGTTQNRTIATILQTGKILLARWSPCSF
jgi:hypothetical protein